MRRRARCAGNASRYSGKWAIERESRGRSITKGTAPAIRATRKRRARCMNKVSRVFRALDDRWGIAGCLADLGNLAREQGDFRTADEAHRESLKIFQELEHKRGTARLLECFACSAAAQAQAERSLRLAGAAAALRQSIGAPLFAAEQAKLEASLDLARRAPTTEEGRTAWLKGWAMAPEQIMEDVLEQRDASGAR